MNREFVFRKLLFRVITAAAGVGAFIVFVVAVIPAPNDSAFFGAVVISAFIYSSDLRAVAPGKAFRLDVSGWLGG